MSVTYSESVVLYGAFWEISFGKFQREKVVSLNKVPVATNRDANIDKLDQPTSPTLARVRGRHSPQASDAD